MIRKGDKIVDKNIDLFHPELVDDNIEDLEAYRKIKKLLQTKIGKGERNDD